MANKTSSLDHVSRETREEALDHVSGEIQEAPVCRRVNDAGVQCGKPLDTTGYPLWCKACRNANRNACNAAVRDLSESRGFAAGVSATKAFVALEFERCIRGASINGYEAARLVRACRGPDRAGI